MGNPNVKWLWIALASSILACGCGQKQAAEKKPTATEQPYVYQDLVPKELLTTLEKRYQILKNFSAQPVRAVITNKLTPFGQENLSGSLVLEKPNKVRLSLAKVHSPFRFDALCDGQQFWLIHHHQKAIYTGLLGEPLNSRGERVALNPVDIFDAVFTPELTGDARFQYRITYVEVPTPEVYVIVVLNSDYPNKLYSKVWVDRSTLHVVRHQLFKPDVGEVKLDAIFSDFVEQTRYDIPHKIVLQWPEVNTSLVLDLKGVKVNRDFHNPNLFNYDHADKEYGEIKITGAEESGTEAQLQERDANRRVTAPARQPLAPRAAPAPLRAAPPRDKRRSRNPQTGLR